MTFERLRFLIAWRVPFRWRGFLVWLRGLRWSWRRFHAGRRDFRERYGRGFTPRLAWHKWKLARLEARELGDRV